MSGETYGVPIIRTDNHKPDTLLIFMAKSCKEAAAIASDYGFMVTGKAKVIKPKTIEEIRASIKHNDIRRRYE